MKYMHMTNALLWSANSVVWFAYAQSGAMGVLSVLATAASIWMWHLTRYD